MKVQEASEKYELSKPYLYDLRNAGKVRAGAGGEGIDEPSLIEFIKNRDITKLRKAKQFERYYEEVQATTETDMSTGANPSMTNTDEMSIADLIKLEKRVKIKDMQLSLLKKEGKMISKTQVRLHYATYMTNAKQVLEELVNNLTPKLYQLLTEAIATGNTNIMGSIKLIITEQTDQAIDDLEKGMTEVKKIIDKDELDELEATPPTTEKQATDIQEQELPQPQPQPPRQEDQEQDIQEDELEEDGVGYNETETVEVVDHTK